ncbi:hypothetical protein VTJ49DRAFT_2130 [Mycothermus thermophilus]|uniref:Ysc84 actin-binding domain-containing protein n=1 Tax=Humicola insolens TaxID=85995 RepID=A0ABR3VNR3_HUMIN
MHRVSALLPSWDRSRQSSTPLTTSPPSASSSAPVALTSLFGWAEKIVPAATGRNTSSAAPPNPLRTRYGRETYWPTTLDKECDKAARIIKSFCFDGFLSQDTDPADPADPADQRDSSDSSSRSEQSKPDKPAEGRFIIKKIPPRIIQNAVGLAVFSCMRSGLWMSGSGGAGLITARKADGTWSPPSAIILHTAELAFVMGVDIYDCLLVINSVQTLEMFTHSKLILGDDVDLAVGPLVADGGPEPDIPWRDIGDTVLTYIKARGKHQAVTLDGSLVSERANENERFYCPDVTILDILAGNVPKHVPEMRPLFEVIKAAEGRSDYDKALLDWLAQQPAPGDADIESPRASIAALTSPTRQTFGMPDPNDPDPFGIVGLEMAGIEIREAGSKLRPTSIHSVPASPRYGRFSRQSMDTFISRSNRGSCMSSRTGATATTDAYTAQTDASSTIDTTYSRANSDDGKDVVDRLPTLAEPDEVDYTQVDTSVLEHLKHTQEPKSTTEPATQTVEGQTPSLEAIKESAAEQDAETEKKEPAVEKDVEAETKESTAKQDAKSEGVEERKVLPDENVDNEDDTDEDDDDEDDDEEEPVICEVATAAPTRASLQRPQITQAIQVRGAIVTIPKRVPPPLPPRSPARISRGSRSEFGDVSSLRSPLRTSLSIEMIKTSREFPEPATTGQEVSPWEASSQESPKDDSPQPSPAHVSAPSSPRHTRNPSSVSTTVAVAIAAPVAEEDEEVPVSSNNSLSSGRGLTSASGSSDEDESDREPVTPQTAEAVINKRSSKTQSQATQDQGLEVVKIVSPSVSPSPSPSPAQPERDDGAKEREQTAVAGNIVVV